ncbi:MAG TPA: hypothetical protein VMX13_14115 [Sedimentisphaerales bacterium]|nr:hypothetical protein [Sedimentisphaerales bacterium]
MAHKTQSPSAEAVIKGLSPDEKLALYAACEADRRNLGTIDFIKQLEMKQIVQILDLWPIERVSFLRMELEKIVADGQSAAHV